jgi:asparagine N-glycosylation enzyme membrane subunit Stt3
VARPDRALLLLALLIALLVRLGTAGTVFVGGQVLIDGTDGYYHLRRAFLINQHFPAVPQSDSFLGPPAGGILSWPPLFDFLLAASARLAPGSPEAALEGVGARLPVLFGLLEVVLVAAVARRLAGPRAGTVAALLAAVLPAVARYSLLGNLDHDPAIESLALLALLPLAGALESGSHPAPARSRPRETAILAVARAALPLMWAGSMIHFGLVVVLLVAMRLVAGPQMGARLGALTSSGALVAALVVAPFAARSPWSRTGADAFAGLSWLHVAALAGLAVAGALLVLAAGARAHPTSRRLAWVNGGAGGLALLLLAPQALPPLLAGLRFLGKAEPFLSDVAESRPLLALFGDFDPRPLLVRLSGLPLLLPFLLLRRGLRRDPALCFGLVWSAYTLALALLQARYSHGAALALAVLGGLAWERLPHRGPRLALALALTPCLAAYVALPGFAGQRFYGRSNDLVTTGMLEVTSYLRGAAPPDPAWRDPTKPAQTAVLAPWGYGHWIHWLGRRATVANPFGPQGQTAFADGIRFWLLEDPATAAALLEAHRVRWVVVPTDGYPLQAYASLAGVDARPWLTKGGEVDPGRYLATLGARLAWLGPEAVQLGGRRLPALPFLREVYRTRGLRRLPDGTLAPLLRVYEVRAVNSSTSIPAPSVQPGTSPG